MQQKSSPQFLQVRQGNPVEAWLAGSLHSYEPTGKVHANAYCMSQAQRTFLRYSGIFDFF
jgi:hypothetical protein